MIMGLIIGTAFFMVSAGTVFAQTADAPGCYCSVDNPAAPRERIESFSSKGSEQDCVDQGMKEEEQNEPSLGTLFNCEWKTEVSAPETVPGTDSQKAFVLPSGVRDLNVFKSTGNTGVARAQSVIGRILKFLTGIMGTFAMVMIVYAGVLWMTASGNAEREKKAQTIIFWATLGLLVMLTSYSIVSFILRNTFQ